MFEIILWLWIAWIALGIGQYCFQRLLPGYSQADNSLYSLGLGYGVLVLLMIGLGFTRLYITSLIGTLLILLSLLIILHSRKDFQIGAITKNSGRVILRFLSLLHRFRSLGRFEQFCIGLAILICFRNFLGSLTPEMRHDVLDYHINFPNLYTLHQGMYETPWHVFSYMPSNVETLYTLALILRSDILAKLIHFGFSLFSAIAIYRIGRRYLGTRIASWALAWWILIPHVTYVTSTAYIEMGISFWEILAIGSLLRYFEFLGFLRPISKEEPIDTDFQQGHQWLWLTGLYTGWALGSKYTVFLLFFLPLVITIILLGLLPKKWKGFDYSLKQAFGAAFTIGLCSFILVSPWLGRNFVWTGNPVFPFFNQCLGLNRQEDLDAEEFMREHSSNLSSWNAFTQDISDQLNQLAMDGTLIVSLFLILSLLILGSWLGGYRSSTQPVSSPHFHLFAGLFAALVLILWLGVTANKDGRFMMPAYVVFCWLLASGYDRVFKWFESLLSWKSFARSLPLILTLFLTFNYASHLVHFYQDLGESPWPVLGRNHQETYLRKRFPLYDMIQYINRELPENSLILGIGYPTHRPYISHVKHGYHPVISRLGKTDYSIEELLWTLQQEKATHLVAPGSMGIPMDKANRLEKAGFISLYQVKQVTLYEVPKAFSDNF